MSGKEVRTLSSADRDIAGAINYLIAEDEVSAATSLVRELDAVTRLIAAQPAAGSPRHGESLGIEGLRSRSLRHHPYLVFYIERADRIDIWRVLHSRRDIPALLVAEPVLRGNS
ncbi:MAG: type II toxin-antitoxin system RelE/ParE family toxin [Bifidobacteriaceae bacterium]|jgi:toxin ParE1/3/4|nr:type II toxin-antitoxin system RelE/ParE family toxin [Bifidobacteriaceae bacterium]